MRTILYIVAIVLVIGWVLGFFIFTLGYFIHALLVFAVIAILVAIIRRQ